RCLPTVVGAGAAAVAAAELMDGLAFCADRSTSIRRCEGFRLSRRAPFNPGGGGCSFLTWALGMTSASIYRRLWCLLVKKSRTDYFPKNPNSDLGSCQFSLVPGILCRLWSPPARL